MTRRTTAIAAPILALLVGGMLVASAPATALYMITPLTLTPSPNEAEIGDEIEFTLAPNPEHEGASHAGSAVKVQYGYDTAEGREGSSSEPETYPEDPDQPVGSEDAPAENGSEAREETTYVYHEIATLTLDDGSRGSFRWTVPTEVDDRNVFVTVLSDAGETLATAHIRVGDAEPIMMVMMEGAPRTTDDEPRTTGDEGAEPALPDGSGTDESATTGEVEGERGANTVPTAGFVAAAAGLGLAALALRRRS